MSAIIGWIVAQWKVMSATAIGAVLFKLLKKKNIELTYTSLHKQEAAKHNDEIVYFEVNEHTFEVKNISGLSLKFKALHLIDSSEQPYSLVRKKGGVWLHGENLRQYDQSHEPWSDLEHDFHEFSKSTPLINPNDTIEVTIQNTEQIGQSLGQLVLSRYYGSDSLWDRFLRWANEQSFSKKCQPLLGNVVAELLVS